jgi:hypothetical protein
MCISIYICTVIYKKIKQNVLNKFYDSFYCLIFYYRSFYYFSSALSCLYFTVLVGLISDVTYLRLKYLFVVVGEGAGI